ncbi:MAG: TauD/TfdA family dioxygenase [SAR324 cluster bacterium]|nr:TauD/TfdA family dioxygenase [SAR324 cluster bacterium]
MSYRHIDVSPVTGALGAQIDPVNLAHDLDGDCMEEIRRAFLEHQVIFFRGQDLTPERQIAFSHHFGELELHEYVDGMPGHPEVIAIVKEAGNAGYNFGGRWHSDVTYQERPALGSVLYGVEVPPYGGDTLFASQYLAYETLSDGMKQMLDGMKAVHSAARTYGPEGRAASTKDGYTKSMSIIPGEKATETMLHPVVRTHPETGRKCLFVNGTFTENFEDMTREESAPLLEYLCRHAISEEFTCRFRWESGSVAFWDNRCVQHYALNDYHGHRREMHRVTISGDRPV